VKCLITNTIAIAILCVCILTALSSMPVTAADDAVVLADRAVVQALERATRQQQIGSSTPISPGSTPMG